MILNVNKIEAELLRDSLQYWQRELNDGLCGRAHGAAGKFVYPRCDELIAKLDAILATKDAP